jgi:hypothetical protein
MIGWHDRYIQEFRFMAAYLCACLLMRNVYHETVSLPRPYLEASI